MPICLSCKQHKSLRGRGCCVTCYERYATWVDRGEVTWQALEDAGLTRPRTLSGATIRALWAAAHPPAPQVMPQAPPLRHRPRPRPWGHGQAVQQALAAIAALETTRKEP